MHRRRWIVDAIVILTVLAAVAGIFVVGGGRRPGPRHDMGAYALRGVLTGFVIYAQNNGDAFPPPDGAVGLLVNSGIVPPELFTPPAAAPGESAFYAVVVPAKPGRWSNSFSESRPLLYANPRGYGGSRTIVGFTDGHTDYVTVETLERMIKESGGRAVPVR